MVNEIIKWTATVITLFGALLTSMHISPLNIYILNIGSIIWLVWSIRVKENAMIAVNLGLLAIYAMGLFI